MPLRLYRGPNWISSPAQNVPLYFLWEWPPSRSHTHTHWHTHTLCDGCIRMYIHCYLGQTVFTPNICKHLKATVWNHFSTVNMTWRNVYANVISKLMGFHVNNYWLRTSVWCVRSLHSSGKVALQHPKCNQTRWAEFCQVKDKEQSYRK